MIIILCLISLVFSDVINTVTHETSDGILKLTYNKSLTVSYESYKTGVYYERIYTEGSIMEIHPLFRLDPSLIKDCIEEYTPILHIDEVVTVTYEIEYARRNYVIIFEIKQKIYGDIDIDILNLQRQNKVLLKKNYVLTKSVEKLEYKWTERLIEYDSKLVKLNKKIDVLVALYDKSLIENNDILDSYDEMIYRMLTSRDISKVELAIKINGDANVYNYLGNSPLHYYVEDIGYGESYGEKNLKIIYKLVEGGIDINMKIKNGDTPLAVCKRKFTIHSSTSNNVARNTYDEIIRYLVANGATE